ncbi:uncharacterized protein LOC126106629 [Schistocerca cancellata]|uniref:uncharacterized protein LOC126106629 n=1 Tax=Schistocerca cancellata TaxID=274614 RepID=UPI00211911FE|nr:uncharacterized protein LOC126106629 [Schistocerca cancellata]
MFSLESVLESLPLFEEETALKYSKGARRKGDGFRYEEMVIALVFLRCLRKRLPDFELTSDNYYAGRFDDIVVTWRGDRHRYALLVQLKHKTSTEYEKIKKGHLFSTSDNNKSDFNIWKYNKSFRSVKKNLNGGQYALVLLTNVPLHDNALGFFTERRTTSVLGADLLEAGGRVYKLDTRAVSGCDPDFMEHFFMFCNQKSVNEITDDICAELVHLLGPTDSYERLCEELCRCVMEWKDTPSEERESISGSWTKWRGIVRQHRVTKINDCDRLTTRLKFRSVEGVRRYVDSANPACVRPLSADTVALTVTKVHQAIHPETHIMVNVKRFRESQLGVLRWWGPSCRWLVLVDDDQEERRQCLNLLNKMRVHLQDGRRLIVVSMREEASFKDSFWCGDVSDESWDDLMLTKIRLNGAKRKCQLGELVSNTAELQNLLKHRLSCLIALARNSGCVKLGQTFEPLSENYVPRQLVTQQYVKDEFFSSLAVRDVCIADNSTCRILLEKLGYLMKNYKVCTLGELEKYLALHMSVPILAKTESIDIIALERICRKYKGLHMFAVKHTERGWNVQYFLAGSGRVRHYVREQTVQLLEALDAFNNKIIVEGRPGIGKSTMLLHLATEVKQNNPSSWVVQIDLRECYEKFEKHMSAEEVRGLFLQSVMFNEGELAELEFNLLQHCLQNYKNMVCLVDNFEEVCPDYAEVFLQALRLLSPSRGKLVVTTRPAAARLLEDHLGSLVHLLPAFSDSQLQKYLGRFRPRALRWRFDGLATPLKNLLRIPLYAEMYRDLMEVGTESHDTVAFCEVFFHYKFGKLYVENFGDKLSDPGKRKEVKMLWRCHEAKLKRLAGLLLVRNKEILQSLIQSSGGDSFVKAGIVHQLTGEKLLFEHRTFAEYFLAKWCFSDASQKACAAVYSTAQSGRNLEFFVEVFDRMASRGRHLLSLLLDGDERRVRALLQAGVGLEERDIWGRNALHLAAAKGVESSLLRLLCQKIKAALAKEDGLLHWTPLQYAANRGHWDTVETLLQAGADLNQLVNIQNTVSLLLLSNNYRVNGLLQNLLVRSRGRWSFQGAEYSGRSTVKQKGGV